MDVSKLITGERPVEIMHPGKPSEKLGIRCNMMHIDDERLERIKRQITDEKQRLAARGDYFKADQLEHNQLIVLNAAITSWEWYNPTGEEGDPDFDPKAHPNLDGDEHPEYNRKNLKRMVALGWFKDQVVKPIGDTEGFFTVSQSV